jgi:hypothetical protein
MKTHYNINETEWAKLLAAGVDNLFLVRSLPRFDINDTGCEINKFHLMYFIDKHGDFTGQKTLIEKVAMAIFNSLSPPDKVEIIHYIPDDGE